MNKLSTLLIAVAGALVLAAVIFLLTQKTPTYAPSQGVSQVEKASDLDVVDQELDKENINAIDSDLNKIDADSSTF